MCVRAAFEFLLKHYQQRTFDQTVSQAKPQAFNDISEYFVTQVCCYISTCCSLLVWAGWMRACLPLPEYKGRHVQLEAMRWRGYHRVAHESEEAQRCSDMSAR